MPIPADAIQRFAASLDVLAPSGSRIGLAVSGGPDSLALLVLAAAVRSGTVEAATVDHGLRAEAAAEATMVAGICEELGVPHVIIRSDWDALPSSNIQAEARTMRYRLLRTWAEARGMSAIATGHHADDQAETLLMRLARGAGLAGLAGVRQTRMLGEGVQIIRPLLSWRKAELEHLVTSVGIVAVDDPSNRDQAYDRTRARALLASSDWFSPDRVASSAAALADADDALRWTAERLVAERVAVQGNHVVIDPTGLPKEIVRRLLLHCFRLLGAAVPRGPDLDRAMVALRTGRSASLSGLLLQSGERWTLSPEPPRTH